jgi:hypothetical protein
MLYSNDIYDCNEYAQASPENLHRCAVFVLATIQQQLELTPIAVADMLEQGVASRFAWGAKKRGLMYLDANIEQMYRDAIRFRNRPADLLEVFLRVPGFALVKAGFLCQIFAGSVGCIDVHNVKIYGVPLAATRYAPAKPDTLTRKRERYVELCLGLGGAHALWSRWCDYVANLRPNNWIDGAEVSRFHFEVVSGIETGAIVDLFTGITEEPTYARGDE